ncbi:MAG: riboflavin synthase [Verrucomicrobiota bacterium]|nr:riboflavin synthase [Verrucomicrobiota bacterium]MEE2966954.1 riboflavin synthase [Verrucomicrobiota bacterium]HAA87337.1 riboflavin synthase [Verrucomicrobiales bacterium]|tara:strand:+ start:882 stop:1478 length:597 start_codon:yes stop_codon:yes gene_type:complete
MFTGLIETTASIVDLQSTEEGSRIVINIPFSNELSLGDSVAVNGCCLTVSAIDEEKSSFDLLKQTLKVTALNELKTGMIVNLERALIAGNRMGGHLVTGHIDTVSEVIAYEPIGEDYKLEILLPKNTANLVIEKGSISVDGISLTTAEVDDENGTFTCYITPHTHKNTNLLQIKKGDQVNLEFDLIAKHVERLIKFQK